MSKGKSFHVIIWQDSSHLSNFQNPSRDPVCGVPLTYESTSRDSVTRLTRSVGAVFIL